MHLRLQGGLKLPIESFKSAFKQSLRLGDILSEVLFRLDQSSGNRTIIRAFKEDPLDEMK